MPIQNEDEYAGSYASGEPYAKVISAQPKISLICPKCSKKMKSLSGYTLHIKKCCPDALNNSPYQDRSPHQPKGVWHFKLEEFDPDLKAIDPKTYFITSGEATIKTGKLCDDLEKALKAAYKLLDALKSLKHKAKYLETQWECGRLLLKQKNPRPTSRVYQRTKAKVINANSIPDIQDDSDSDD